MTESDTIATLVDRLSRIAHSLQFSEGLNPAQWNALRFLARANKYSTSPGVLADYLGCTKGTISQTLIALESKGLVARIRCDEDRRKVLLGPFEVFLTSFLILFCEALVSAPVHTPHRIPKTEVRGYGLLDRSTRAHGHFRLPGPVDNDCLFGYGNFI